MAVRRLVVMGGSSGGLDAALAVLQALAPDYKVSTILVLHQLANRVSGVAAMLSGHTHLKVIEPDDKQVLEDGFLYVAPPNYHLLVEREQHLSLSSEAPVHYCRPAIDVTLETAALAFGARLVGCILSGANRDGADGAVQVKRMGGQVLVQSPASAVMDVMPAAAMAAAAVDAVLTPGELAHWLNQWSRNGRAT